jgi:hypothetical protein
MGLAAVLAIFGCLWLAGEANAGVYWGSMGGNTVGRANSDGSGVEPSLITGASQPWGVAVDGTHLYWANFTGHTIGRSNLDGTEVEQSFIENVEPTALAVAAGHIYWTDDGPRSIGRAKLDGTEVEREFIAGAGTFAGLAANSEFLYWGHPSGEGAIARARLDGSGFEEEFIDPAGPLIPYGVAADGGHVYWANSMNDSIGRADLSGGSIEEEFIPNAHPAGVAVDADYIYWGKASLPQAIGRADIDGSNIQSAFVPGVEEAFGLAADVSPASPSTPPTEAAPAKPAPSSLTSPAPYLALHIGKRDRDRRAGKAKVTVGVSGPGELTLSGKHVATVTDQVSAAGRVKLQISPIGAFAHSLESHAASSRIRVAFTPTGGATVVKQTRIRLARQSH